MIKSYPLKIGLRVFLAVCLVMLKMIGMTLALFLRLIEIWLTDDDDYVSPLSNHYNFRTGQIDAVKHPSGIYDE